MAKVTIYTDDGKAVVKTGVSKRDEEFYDDLPFTSSNVVMTTVEDD